MVDMQHFIKSFATTGRNVGKNYNLSFLSVLYDAKWRETGLFFCSSSGEAKDFNLVVAVELNTLFAPL